jgi:hypothetical protein
MKIRRSVEELARVLLANDLNYSVNVHGEIPKDGYMVGGLVPALIVPESSITIDDIKGFIEFHYLRLLHANTYLGVWTHEGNVYVDISRKIDVREEAMRQARNRNEIAIYDVIKGEEIAA